MSGVARRGGTGIGVAVLVAAAFTAFGARGTPAESAQDPQAPGRRTWRGVRTETIVNSRCRTKKHLEFEYVENMQQGPRWLARSQRWNNAGSCGLESATAVVEGGRRFDTPWSVHCESTGDVDLETWDGRAPERCEQTPAGLDVFGKIFPNVNPPSWAPVPEHMLRDGCRGYRHWADSRRWTDNGGGLHVITEVVTLTEGDPLGAVIEIDGTEGAYSDFVPAPGATITFTASTTGGSGRFRFELDPEGTSQFPGYATNAYVDDLFFETYGLNHLRGTYLDVDPDVIFDASHYDGAAWSRIEPLVVETREAASAASVTVTAMDYGAVGRLRAFVRPEGDCGPWGPVAIRIEGADRESLAIPLDDDENLMADALDDFRLLDPGSDLDGEPQGNGTPGDGLTAFEEYRGFETQGSTCEAPQTRRHTRTSPDTKSLFVLTDRPDVDAIVTAFGETLGLDLHLVCGRHIVDGEEILAANLDQPNLDPGGEWVGSALARVINHTLHESMLSPEWGGRRVRLDHPQRALVVRTFYRTYTNQTVGYPAGVAIPVTTGSIGPPGLTTLVLIATDRLLTSLELAESMRRTRAGESTEALDRVMDERFIHRVVHELGHAVGMPHHGNSVADWRDVLGPMNVTAALSPRQRGGGSPDFSLPEGDLDVLDGLLVDPGPACAADDPNAFFEGRRLLGCLTTRIVRRGQQNSGNFMCPMRYPFGDDSYYEPPGTEVAFAGTREISGPQNYSVRHTVDVWNGRVLRYDQSRERTPLGWFCSMPAGTEINAGSGDSNHAGDAGTGMPCLHFMVISDAAAAGGGG